MESMRRISVLPFLAALAACSSSPRVQGAPPVDASMGTDGSSGMDGATESGSDAALEVGSDGAPESGADGATDGGSDGPAFDAGFSGDSGLPDCAGLAATCGPAHDESCCTTEAVTGGTFARSYDDVTYTDSSFTATVSSFDLDRFLVTVGRMRAFVTAVETGWLPVAGSGKHTHLNGGAGLNGGTEGGWDPTWNAMLATTRQGWDSALLCDPTFATWTSSAGANEDLPINCVEWQEAYAFCIWDGGFLPSEAEWNYAAAGGSDQRVYPWSSPATSTTIDCSYVNYDPGPACSSPFGLNAVGSESPKGDGKFGQADVVGNVWEWQLDYFATPYPQVPCNDCANLTAGTIRSIRGATYGDDATYMAVSYRHNYSQTGHVPLFGVRCARAP
jgi:sulfatase modifying factor 1